ncbi:MAG: thiamine pyrophosphate-dependent dehydrogenase E1 component subunit alpha [Candidatus Dormibacteria bacterium]
MSSAKAEAEVSEVGSHEALGLTRENLAEILRHMLLARVLDEKMWLLNRQGKAAFVISCQGHEGAQVGSAYALRRGEDWFCPYYRDLAIMTYLGMTPREIMLSVFAKEGDPNSGARQMPAHYGSRKLKVVTGSSPVATHVVHAVGVALAARIRGEDALCATYVGEGGTSTGDWHEAMNFAAIHKLPVLFFVENNNYAISVPMAKQFAVDNLAVRGAAYGMPGHSVDGLDVLEVYRVTRAAADRARAGEGPSLIELRTVRMTPHSSDDSDRYRSRELLAELRAMDPVQRFAQVAIEAGAITETGVEELRLQFKAEVDQAADEAEAAPFPDASQAFTRVYAD